MIYWGIVLIKMQIQLYSMEEPARQHVKVSIDLCRRDRHTEALTFQNPLKCFLLVCLG